MKSETNESVLLNNVTLKGANVLDIGCGTGEMVRTMRTAGGVVTGLECNDSQLALAQAYEPAGSERYCFGFGQDLPFTKNSFDVVTFFNSLHHIPTKSMDASLKEASRVLKTNGVIHIAEPIASGSGFEVHAPVDDETVVRKFALEAIHNSSAHSLRQVREVLYHTVYHYPDFDAFEQELVRIDSSRQAIVDAKRDQLIALFNKLGVRDELGTRFDQPMRVNILTAA